MATGADLAPADARCLLRAWLAAVELDHLDERGLIAYMQDEGFSHSDLYRRACRLHERKLRWARVSGRGRARAAARRVTVGRAAARQATLRGLHRGDPLRPGHGLPRQRAGQARSQCDDADGEPPRVAIVADGIGSMHGVTRTIEEIRQRGVPGFEIEVVGTDPDVDRRLSAVAEVDVPYYPGLRIGVPSLPAAVQTLADGGFDALHVCSPGPAGVAGALLARAMGLPLIGSYHTELTAYAQAALRRGIPGRGDGHRRQRLLQRLRPRALPQPRLRRGARLDRDGPREGDALGPRRGRLALRPRAAAMSCAIAVEGMACPGRSRANRDEPGPLLSTARMPSGNVLYAGRITREKGIDLLAEAFLLARARDPRLHLVLAGGGPEQERLRERVGEHATFLGWLEGDGARARLRLGRRLPVPQRDRHLRPGHPRGAGARTAGARGRRGRPAAR